MLGIAEAERGEPCELGAELERQVAAVDERVHLRGRAQVVLAESAVADRGEGLGEGLDALRLDREPRRRRVAAPALEVAGALAQPVVEVEAGIERPEPFQSPSVPAIRTTGRL